MKFHKHIHALVNISIVLGIALSVALFVAPSALAQSNPVILENEKTGTNTWRIPKERAALLREIEGYASATSVNATEPITFYVNVDTEQPVTIEIYRMGYYGGTNGRLIETLPTVSVSPKDLSPANTLNGLIECDWEATRTWTPPRRIASGFFLAKLKGIYRDSYIIFVVRNDGRTSDFVLQSAVTTYQAYNNFPGLLGPGDNDWLRGRSLYPGNSYGPDIPDNPPQGVPHDKQARMVSFNRPYFVNPKGNVAESAGHFFQWEYHMVRWMERNGLDVSYITNVDTHSDVSGNFTEPGRHKAFLTAGHDEYYSWEMRDNLEQARNRSNSPLNLGFFSSNDVYWQIRFADSSANTTPANTANRTIICYKEHAIDGGIYGDPNRSNDFDTPAVYTDNHLITQRWRHNKAFTPPNGDGVCPGPGGGYDCYKAPEEELVGAMTDLDFIDGEGDFTFFDDPFSDHDCPVGCWIRANVISSSFLELVGYEPIKVVNDYYPEARSIFRIVAQSTVINSGGSDIGHAVYYKMNNDGGRVFTVGSNKWTTGLDSEYLQSAEVGQTTMNILNCFKDGGLAPNSCGGVNE